MKKKKALITGITGQDGSYLAELLLKKNYSVYGLNRRTSLFNTARIEHIFNNPKLKDKTFHLQYGDMTDSSSINRLVTSIKPDEIYNLAAQSHVSVSFEAPEYTADTIALGTLRLLEAIKHSKKDIKFYNASTSELYGNTNEVPQNEKTNFQPRSPYGVAKLYSHWITVNYRESFNLFACNGILFNHESPRRGDTFVTKKITNSLYKISNGSKENLILGNLYSKRDWGHAKEYVEMQYRMLQQKKPKDYVIATGKNYTIKTFVSLVCKRLNLKLEWKGKGLKEKGYINGTPRITIDKKYFRPAEVENLLGDASLAMKDLKWKSKFKINDLIEDMIGSLESKELR